MSIARFGDFKRTGRGGSSQPGGSRGKRNLRCSSAQGQTENSRSYLRVSGSRKNKILTNEANNEGSLKQSQKWQKRQKLFWVTSNQSDWLAAQQIDVFAVRYRLLLFFFNVYTYPSTNIWAMVIITAVHIASLTWGEIATFLAISSRRILKIWRSWKKAWILENRWVWTTNTSEFSVSHPQ